MQVVHVDRVCDRDVAKFVGLPVRQAGLKTAPRQPDREAPGVVVATGPVFLGVGCAAELGPAPHDGVFQQAPLGEIGQQPRQGAIAGAGMIGVLRQVRVLVPRRVGGVVAVGHLHEPRSLFAQPAGQQAEPAELIGRLAANAIQGLGGGGLLRQIEHLGHAGLQPPRQFIALDDCLEFALHGRPGCLLAVEFANQVELPALLCERFPRRSQVLEGRLTGGLPGPAERGSLVPGGQEPGSVVTRPPIARRGSQRDKRREIGILGPQSIREPRSQAGPHLVGRATVQKQGRRPVGHPFSLHRVDEAKPVDVRGDVGKQFRDPPSALPVLLELPRRLHDPLGRPQLAGVGEDSRVVERHLLAVVQIEPGLVVERVDLAGSPLQEDKDHPLGPRGMVRGGSER